jgi:hypothetical protein
MCICNKQIYIEVKMASNFQFSNEKDFKTAAFKYTFNNFEEFLKEFPKFESENLKEKFKKENKEILQHERDMMRIKQEKEFQRKIKQEAEERQRLEDERDMMRIKQEKEFQRKIKQEAEERQRLEDERDMMRIKQEKEFQRKIKQEAEERQHLQDELDMMRIKQEKEQQHKIKQETENRQRLQQEIDTMKIKQQNEFEEKIQDYKKIIEEYKQATIKKSTGVNSLYKGETFEKYIEIILQDKFKKFTIDGDKKMNCMDIRMTSANLNIGLECKAKQKVSAQDVNKFMRDKVNNSFDGAIFISESPIPNMTTTENEWTTKDNTLWIQSKNETVILSAMKTFLNTLEQDTNESETQADKKTITEHQDFILTTYDNFQAQKKSMVTQEKQLYKWIKQNKPQKLKNHLFIVTASKFTKHYKETPY